MARVLFVCMGNICRSPTAEGVFKHLVEKRGLQGRVISDSAGTHDYHVGEPPDARAMQAAARRGYDLSSLRARQVAPCDFDAFDYLLAMDENNLTQLRKWAPKPHAEKAQLFLEFSSLDPGGELPDPYYGGAAGFERVLDLVEDAAARLLDEIEKRLG
jgi:protein-tyrosine phosphatase